MCFVYATIRASPRVARPFFCHNGLQALHRVHLDVGALLGFTRGHKGIGTENVGAAVGLGIVILLLCLRLALLGLLPLGELQPAI
jgi:hypothetical protein